MARFHKSDENEFIKDPTSIEANPGQSKHLEATKVKLWDIELDLANLGTEESPRAVGSRTKSYATFSTFQCTDSLPRLVCGTPLVGAIWKDL